MPAMTPFPIAEDQQRFILRSLASVPHLEAVLLLREGRERRWSGAQVAQRLYLSEKAALQLLADLCASGMLRHDADGLYAYAPQGAELARMLDRVADTYSRNLIGVSTLIHSKSKKQAQVFADAFIWRKEP
jgi:Mn-dependent DtxR family transcriptional regulator